MTPAFVPPAGLVSSMSGLAGAAGRAWVDSLPAALDEALRRTDLRLDGAARHGMCAVVVPVRSASGAAFALKLSWADEDSRPEPLALAGWAGAGAVRLVDSWQRADGQTLVLLLDRLDPQRDLTTVADHETATVLLAQVLARLSVPGPDSMPRLADRASRWAAELPQRFAGAGAPLPRRVLDAALATCRELGPSSGSTLLHGDLHYSNVLAAPDGQWLAIDPKGLTGDQTFEATPALWNRWDDLVATGNLARAVRRRLDVLCEVAALDPERAVRWSVVRALDNLLGVVGATDVRFAASQRVILDALGTFR